MNTIGQIEKQTQARVVALFSDRLGYEKLGNWIDRAGNANIEMGLLTTWLEKQEVEDLLIKRALHELGKVASDTSKHLYDRNRAVYDLLRYGVKVQPGAGENRKTVWLIDWKQPENNHFAIAEEVTIKGADAKASTKRPDVVLYINGIALGVLELKRSTVSVAEGIRQNLDNQKTTFIQPFFSTMQWVMAGNDSEGLRYATIETPEKYYLKWFEESGPYASEQNPLDRQLLQVCTKERFLELIHDFVVFDAGIKKVCRQNQYFGVKSSQEFIRRREGGIIWHTQGSGKSLTMVWLAKWIRENRTGARVLIITDRTELDEQIEKVFKGVNEQIYRTKSGDDLVATLNNTSESLICSLIHKFGHQENVGGDQSSKAFIAAIQQLPNGFMAKGDIHVFVDECHRTQSVNPDDPNKITLHQAMKALLPNAIFIGFTGTPLLKVDKQKSIEIFGRYIHTYKFDQAVREGVVLDLRYEAREIEQSITSPQKVDEWFDAKTKGLNDLAKAQLKQRWGTMQRVLSSQSRLEKIAADIMLDMNTKPRLMDGHGNALLVAGSIYEACKFYELFSNSELQNKCAVVTSYVPSLDDIKGETTGDGETDSQLKYRVYSQMLANWLGEPEKRAIQKVEQFEKEVKKQFIDEPGQMKLLIVVDKLLTGFDAPPATYLYIDKQMRDHGLFQAICRVNRLDGDDKEYGYIVDYKDLFKQLEGAVEDYTSGALDGYDKTDVAGLLENRLAKAREKLEEAREAVKALCEPVEAPKDSSAYLHYFCAMDSGNAEQLRDNEPKRLTLYKFVASLLRAYASIANELPAAGYQPNEIGQIKNEVDDFSNLCDTVRLASGDYIDLKTYEPAMRHLIDTYIRAEASEKVSAFDNMSLIQLIVEQGQDAVNALPKSIKKSEKAVAETIENNVRRIITNESPVDPAYYERISKLLDALIEQRRKAAISYHKYLKKIAQLARDATMPGGGPGGYPAPIKTAAQRALYNNLGKNADLALAVDTKIQGSPRQDGWRDTAMKSKQVRRAIHTVLQDNALTDKILELARHQNEY